ncbi:four helix bundle protein [Occallatibacter riparius]|uniref:Four helix bundle protein n=1 Tax=Occallatibacter riparius TaxID=1002689 RepID=A0A9J7BSM2_9BACT|nr:four helix bundle protein [Occallatibacter riparius]UWZ83902.1 four helix bundle protein [Occallatibacter riparius]
MGESFRDNLAWQRAIELTTAVYKLTAAFPSSERFGLTDQMRRAAVSVASNISEGYGRSTRGEYVQFLGHARGSLCELQTQMVISEALGYGDKELRGSVEELSAKASLLLNRLFDKMKEASRRSRTGVKS